VGGNINLSSTVILLYAAYLVLAPLILLVLILAAHNAMKRYKETEMFSCSRKLQEKLYVIAKTNLMEIQENNNNVSAGKYLEECQNAYEFYKLLARTPEWPIKMLNLRRFTSFAVIPGLTGVISPLLMAYDVMDILAKFTK
jgi:hypothetical protein